MVMRRPAMGKTHGPKTGRRGYNQGTLIQSQPRPRKLRGKLRHNILAKGRPFWGLDEKHKLFSCTASLVNTNGFRHSVWRAFEKQSNLQINLPH
jgi:hypothetical protein